MFNNFIYLLLAIPEPHCCIGFSLVVNWGYSLAVVCRLLTVMVSLVAEHWL